MLLHFGEIESQMKVAIAGRQPEILLVQKRSSTILVQCVNLAQR